MLECVGCGEIALALVAVSLWWVLGGVGVGGGVGEWGWGGGGGGGGALNVCLPHQVWSNGMGEEQILWERSECRGRGANTVGEERLWLILKA